MQGLAAPLTVVTGPPGTGKSQVVTSLLANVAWQEGQRAVREQEITMPWTWWSRVSTIWGRCRCCCGWARKSITRASLQHLTAALAESASTDAATRYAWLMRAHEQDAARFAAVQREIAAVVSLRNRVDELERAAEPARTLFGRERFAALRNADMAAIRRRLQALAGALAAARESGEPAMVRLLRDSGKNRRLERIAEAGGCGASRCGNARRSAVPRGTGKISGAHSRSDSELGSASTPTGRAWRGCGRRVPSSSWRAI